MSRHPTFSIHPEDPDFSPTVVPRFVLSQRNEDGRKSPVGVRNRTPGKESGSFRRYDVERLRRK